MSEPGSPEQDIEERLTRVEWELEWLSQRAPASTLVICNRIAERCRAHLKASMMRPVRKSA